MPEQLARSAGRHEILMKFVPFRLLKLVGWSTASYGVSWSLRLGQQLILTRLLSPELFGLMMIILTLRTGLDLFTDIGIGQNIVSNKNAEKRDFYDTAWTLQVVRGLGLALLCCAAAVPLARFYDQPILASALPVASLYFVFGGLESMGRFLIQKRVDIVSLSLFEVGLTIIACAGNIICALITPTVWALVWGSVISMFATMIVTFFMIPSIRHRLFISREYAREILGFGKWVFVSTLVYFLATNFDRLYMAKVLPLAVLGVYGIARSLTDLMTQLVLRFGSHLVFPLVASSEYSRAELRHRIARIRFRCLALGAVGTSLFPVVSGYLVRLLYDARYHDAASMMPLLSIGVWFAILCTLNEAVMLGIARPIYSAAGNGAKLALLVVALPLGIAHYGIAGAIGALVLVEIARYVPIWIGQKREQLSFGRQDALLTAAMFALIALWLSLIWSLGWSHEFPLLPTLSGTMSTK